MRASRLLSILIQLQLHRRVTAVRLAEQFEVSVRTIYRDIDALSAAGVPVYGDAGPGGGFALLEGYRTQLTGLNTAEAEAMPLLGLPDAADALGLADAVRVRDKMFAALGSAVAPLAGLAARCIHIDLDDWYRAFRPVPHLREVARATLDGRQINMLYRGWARTGRWTIDPLGLVMKGGHWYLAARDTRRIRIVRVDAMDEVIVLDNAFDRPVDFDLAQWWRDESARFERELHGTTLDFRASDVGRSRLAAHSARGAAAAAAARRSDDGWWHGELDAENSDHGIAALLSLGSEIEIVGPPDIRTRLAELALNIAHIYSSSIGVERGKQNGKRRKGYPRP